MQIEEKPPALSEPSSLRIEPIGLDQLDTIRWMNHVIFDEERIINSFEREDLLMLLASVDDEPVGFKIGYRESRQTFYSAKGGVLEEWRRLGISRKLLYAMIEYVRRKGYRTFAFDTFPNKHPGMTVMGLDEGFKVTRADYNPAYKDFRLRFEKKI